MVVGTKLRDEFKTEPIVKPMERSAYVFDNGKISYGMLQAKNEYTCTGFHQIFNKIKKKKSVPLYLAYNGILQIFSDLTKYISYILYKTIHDK